jgi:hypothetical protein
MARGFAILLFMRVEKSYEYKPKKMGVLWFSGESSWPQNGDVLSFL